MKKCIAAAGLATRLLSHKILRSGGEQNKQAEAMQAQLQELQKQVQELRKRNGKN